MKCKHVSDLWLFHTHFLVWYVTYWETLANRLHVSSSSTTTSVKPLLVFTLKRILYVLLRIGVFINYSYFNTFSFLLYIYCTTVYFLFLTGVLPSIVPRKNRCSKLNYLDLIKTFTIHQGNSFIRRLLHIDPDNSMYTNWVSFSDAVNLTWCTKHRQGYGPPKLL